MDERNIFEHALDLTDPKARAVYLDEACGGDDELRSRVEALLGSHEDAGSFLQTPVEAVSPTIDGTSVARTGDRIGPYKLLQKLGEGGMGEVYMAEQSEPVERRVAVKIIKAGMDTRQVIARFEAERQALAMMDHPNIAKVFDAGMTDAGKPYFVMELVKGVPITQYCDEHRLDPRQRLELFQDVCHAVQHAHQKGIIHRDLKPSNVMVAEYDDHAVPKIIDFGVAKATQQRLTEKTMFTEVGTVVGTIEYMSPEQAKLNQLDIDTRSDIYSLGVLLYELLTGEMPFDRKRLRSAALDEMLRIIREEEPSRPSIKLGTSESLPSIAASRKIEPKRLSALMRGELDWIVMKALEKERSRRYETANAFSSDIENYLNDEAVDACPPSAAYRFRKFARRNKGVLAATTLTASLLLAGLAGTSWQAIRATKAEATTRAEATRADKEATRASREAERARQEARIAVAERTRSDENLDLAFEALDEVYLRSIGQDRSLATGNRENAKPALSDAERELLQLAMNFYAKLANQNQSGDRASLRTAAALNRLGKIQYRLYDRKSARQSFQKSIERLRDLDPPSSDQTEYWRELGRAYFHLADLSPWRPDSTETFRKSLGALDHAVKADPAEPYSRELRARVYYALNRDSEAAAEWLRAIELKPGVAHWHAHVSRNFAHNKNPLLIDHQVALKHAQKAVELSPEDPEYLAFLGRRLWDARRDQKLAQAQVDRAIELDPDCVVALIQRTILFNYWGRHKEALPSIERAIKLDPQNAEALRVRGTTYRGLDRVDDALASYDASLRFRPNVSITYSQKAELLKKHGHHAEAVEAASRAIELAPKYSRTYKARARSLFNLGRFDEAMDDLRAALKYNPDATSTLTLIPLADVAACPDEEFKKGLLELASSAVETEKNKLDLAQYKVRVIVALGETDHALKEAERALERNPDSAVLWSEIGLLHVEQADLTNACENLRRSLELDPSWLTYYQLALCQAAAGETSEYRATCQAMADAHADSSKSVELNFTAWTATLAPDALADFGPAIEAAEAAVKTNLDDEQFQRTLGAVLFRAGHADRAIEQLSRLDEPDEKQTRSSPAYGWYFLAMAHHVAGNQDRAGEYLAQANLCATAELSDGDKRPLWNRRLTLQLLRREATDLISASPPVEQDKSSNEEPAEDTTPKEATVPTIP